MLYRGHDGTLLGRYEAGAKERGGGAYIGVRLRFVRCLIIALSFRLPGYFIHQNTSELNIYWKKRANCAAKTKRAWCRKKERSKIKTTANVFMEGHFSRN